jgi:hypothetical protein
MDGVGDAVAAEIPPALGGEDGEALAVAEPVGAGDVVELVTAPGAFPGGTALPARPPPLHATRTAAKAARTIRAMRCMAIYAITRVDVKRSAVRFPSERSEKALQ